MSAMTRWPLAVTVALFLCSSTAAQTRPEGNWEFAMLGGISLYGHDNVLDGEVGVEVPNGANLRTIPFSSSLRVTYWTRTPITLEFGAGYLHEGASIVMAEIGLGVNLRERTSRFQPFLSAVVGLWSDGFYRSSVGPLAATVSVDRDDGLHIGLTGGAKLFIRDYACLRLQAGLRSASFRDEKVLEILTGLGFFL